MEDVIKKLINATIGLTQSVYEEVTEHVEKFAKKGESANDDISVAIKDFVDKSINNVKEFGTKVEDFVSDIKESASDSKEDLIKEQEKKIKDLTEKVEKLEQMLKH